VLQQILNSLGTRQVITRGVNDCELVWTLLDRGDTEEQTCVRSSRAISSDPRLRLDGGRRDPRFRAEKAPGRPSTTSR